MFFAKHTICTVSVSAGKTSKVFAAQYNCMCREKHEGFPMYSIYVCTAKNFEGFRNAQYHIVCAAKNTKVFHVQYHICMCREKHEGFPMYSIILYVPRKTRGFPHVQYHIVCAVEKHEGFPMYSMILYMPENLRGFPHTVSYCKNTKVFHIQYHTVCAAKNTKVFHCTVSYCMCREKHEGFPMYSMILYVPRKTRRFSNTV